MFRRRKHQDEDTHFGTRDDNAHVEPVVITKSRLPIAFFSVLVIVYALSPIENVGREDYKSLHPFEETDRAYSCLSAVRGSTLVA
jgi:hypothetical protein